MKRKGGRELKDKRGDREDKYRIEKTGKKREKTEIEGK